MAQDIAAITADDGVEFDTQSIDVQQIRDDADYPGLRLRMPSKLHTAKGTIVWDVSTGDPIVPTPRVVHVPRALGDDIEILGYAGDRRRRKGGRSSRARYHEHTMGATTPTSCNSAAAIP